MVEWIVEPFATDHDRSGFSCGSALLDDFIRARVSQYEKRRLGKTFVAVPQGQKRVIGYYTLAAGTVAFAFAVRSRKKIAQTPCPGRAFGPVGH